MEYKKIKEINEYKFESINPMKTPDTMYELYSVPFFTTGHPEYLHGSEIGSSKVIVQKNDILVCKINPRINRVWVVADESNCQSIASSEWIVVRNAQYNPYFLAWYFRTSMFQQLMTSEVTGIGGSLTRAQPKRVAEYPVPVLPRERQDEIASILGHLQSIKYKRKNELDLLDSLVKARFVEMFGNPNEINKIANARIKDVASVKVGIVIKPTQFYSDDKTGKCAFRSLNIIPFGVKKNSEWVYFTDAAMSENKRTIVHEGDLLIVRSGNPGTCCVVPREYDGCNVIDLIIAHPDNSKILPEYLCAFTNMPHGMNQINNQQHGVAQRHFNVSMYEKMKLYVPKLSMQHQFVDFMIRADKSKVAIDHCVILIRKALQSGYHHVWGD